MYKESKESIEVIVKNDNNNYNTGVVDYIFYMGSEEDKTSQKK